MIRPWKREDLPEIAEIERACFSEPWSLRALEEGFGNPDFRCFVCECGGKVAGYANALLAADEIVIANVATSPDFRRKGIAEQTLSALLSELGAAGARAATLEVRPSNLAAKSLYRKLGFVCEGRRKRFYSDGEDAEILWKRF